MKNNVEKEIKNLEKQIRNLISAQVFGNGIDRWILSQGDAIEVIEDN